MPLVRLLQWQRRSKPSLVVAGKVRCCCFRSAMLCFLASLVMQYSDVR